MTDEVSIDLIVQIGELILDDGEFEDIAWDSISLVASFFEGSREITGYAFTDDGKFEPAIPWEAGEVLDKLEMLNTHMEASKQGAFVQCLIQITKPDHALRLQFEHDDPKRWSVAAAIEAKSSFSGMLHLKKRPIIFLLKNKK